MARVWLYILFIFKLHSHINPVCFEPPSIFTETLFQSLLASVKITTRLLRHKSHREVHLVAAIDYCHGLDVADNRGRWGGDDHRDCGHRLGEDDVGSGGGDDGRLCVTKEPLDGLTVGAVTEFAGYLEFPGDVKRRYANMVHKKIVKSNKESEGESEGWKVRELRRESKPIWGKVRNNGVWLFEKKGVR